MPLERSRGSGENKHFGRQLREQMFYPFESKEESMFVELMATNLVLKKWRRAQFCSC